jgi:hypothetical protein
MGMHSDWKKVKDALSSEEKKKLPKEDFGPNLDTYETMTKKLKKTLEEAAAALQEWNDLYETVNTTAGNLGTAGAKFKGDYGTDLANIMRGIRVQGVVVATAYGKVKTASDKYVKKLGG